MVNEKDLLRIDMLGYKYIPDYYLKIIEHEPTPEDLARWAKDKRDENIKDFLAAFYAGSGLFCCVLAPCAMFSSIWGALFFIPAIFCTWRLKRLVDP